MQYGLSNRGIRVITGSNLDDDGSQSNGAGKSVLVMAPLWALTGRSDARSEASPVHSSPVHSLPSQWRMHVCTDWPQV